MPYLTNAFFGFAALCAVLFVAPAASAQNPGPNALATDSGKVFTIVEEMPSYPGGQIELFRFIASNTKYPAVAKEQAIEGTVYVNFQVDIDGSIKNVRVIRGVDPLLDAEAVRVINAMPNWTPGMQRGKPVKVSYNLPMRFTLSAGFGKDGKDKKKKKKKKGDK